FGLAGEGAAVELEVKLADVAGEFRLWREGGEVFVDAAHAEAGEGGKVFDAGIVFQHLLAGAAGAVAPTEGEETFGMAGLALKMASFAAEVAPGAEGVEGDDVAVVAVAGGE